MSANNIVKFKLNTTSPKPLTAEQRKRLQAISMLPDAQIEVLASELTAIRTERDNLKTEVNALNLKLTEAATSLTAATGKVETLLAETTTLTATCKDVTDKLALLESVSKAAEHKQAVLAEITTAGLNPADTNQISESLLALLLDLTEPQRKTFIAERAGLFKTAPGAFLRDDPSKKSSGDFVPGEYSKKFLA